MKSFYEWHAILFDPRGRSQSRPVVITIFTQSVRPSVPKLQNQATITAGRDCGQAELIIDDSCLVKVIFDLRGRSQSRPVVIIIFKQVAHPYCSYICEKSLVIKIIQ